MVLKLYSHVTSPFSNLVQLVLNEKGVEYEAINVDLLDPHGVEGNRGAKYLAIHPFGTVPTLDDDGLVINESRAIARYLASKYADQGTPLLPAPGDLKALARFEQAVSFETSHFNITFNDIAFELIWKFYHGETETDQAKLDDALKRAREIITIYDRILEKQRYIGGDTFSLADIFHIPYGALITSRGVTVLEEKPNVSRWWKEITSRPTWTPILEAAKELYSPKA